MRVALENTGTRRIDEASPHEKVGGIGLTASDLRPAFPTLWCGLNLLGQVPECTRETIRQNIAGDTQLDDDNDDTAFEVDPITHVRLDRPPPTRPSSRRLPIRCPTIIPLRYY